MVRVKNAQVKCRVLSLQLSRLGQLLDCREVDIGPAPSGSLGFHLSPLGRRGLGVSDPGGIGWPSGSEDGNPAPESFSTSSIVGVL